MGLVLSLGLPVAGCAQAGGAPGTDAAAAPAASLPQQWQALRSLPGHFDGAAWNDAVDRWQGQKHRVMQQLAQQALSQRLSAERLNALMGAPDQTLAPDLPDRAGLLQQTRWQGTPTGDLWLYRWRGTHDQLVFALDAGQVVATGWLYALE